MILIYLYSGTEPELADSLEKLYTENGQEVVRIGDAALDLTLAEMMASPPEDTGGSQPAFLYYGGLEVPEIEKLEKEVSKSGLVCYRKAVENDNNRQWKLGNLMKEVDKEAAYFKMRDRLWNLIENADQEKLKSDPQYYMICSMAYGLLQQNVGPEVLETAAKAIENYKKSPD